MKVLMMDEGSPLTLVDIKCCHPMSIVISCWYLRSISLPKFLLENQIVAEYIESIILNIEAPRKNDPIIYYVCENIFTGFP